MPLLASEVRRALSLEALPELFRAKAEELAPYSPPAAFAWREAARILADALQAEADELLTLSSAAEESGYSERRLRELLASGGIPQAGRKGAPRIRRSDLPKRKAMATSTYNPVADARRLAGKLP